ncbi:hypothetical protein MFLAVUS_008968 [Mucor flavus]|uniref:Uncharacterized protein n=1 Tax=Mucor flavus TaxID=439312 RepID=A0ABP9Z8Q6_9FUNG
MDRVYDLHQHTHCVIMHIGKVIVTTSILATANRHCNSNFRDRTQIGSSISYNRDRTDVKALGEDCGEESEDNILIDNFYDKLYNLFKKDKTTRDEEDKFLMKAVSGYLPRAIQNTMEKIKLEIESFDLFHYAFIVPSEWEEEMREDIIRPIFVQSGLILNEDHQDRLLFFSDIESICYGLKDKNADDYSFKRGQNTILCRFSPDEEKMVIKFDLIQTTNTLFNFPNSKMFPKVMKSSSGFVNIDVRGRIKEFLRTNLFSVATENGADRKSLKSKLAPVNQDKVIEDVTEQIDSWRFDLLEEESEETKLWSWKLTEVQKEFIQSLCPFIIRTAIDVTLFGNMKDIISNNFSKSYEFLLLMDKYSNQYNRYNGMVPRLAYILECNRRSLNCITTINKIEPKEKDIDPSFLLYGASKGVFEAIQHSDIYCKPRIVSSEDSNTSSSVFLNSKPDAIVNLDISLGSTLFSYSLLNEDGCIQHIFNHDGQVVNLPPLRHFYTFSNMTTLNVKEQFIPFAEKYLLGDLVDFIVDDGDSIKKDLLFEMKAILSKNLSTGEALISTSRPKYIKAFIFMYVIYIKEEILNKLPNHLLSDQTATKIGYAVSIEAMLLSNTIGTKDNLRDLIYASGLVPKDNDSKKIRITTQGERILPAIQKSLKLELPLKSYFLLCQLHEDYVQLSLHQVVTASTSEKKEQESIIVQDEIVAIPNIYDSLCKSMWHNLVQDSKLIELCEMHNTSDKSKILDQFSSKTKKEFFTILRVHISDNALQNNPGAQSATETNAVKLNNSCNCKFDLTTADIIDISFTPVLQDVACILSGSLLNKGLFGNYMNIDYLFSFIRFSSNPQLQCAFARILEEEADDFNLELGIDTCCLLIPELFSQLLQPVIAQQPLCYKDFEIGALQQVCSGNYAFNVYGKRGRNYIRYKSKITDKQTTQCNNDIVFLYLVKGEIIKKVRLNRTFYLRNERARNFAGFDLDIYSFKTTNYLEDNETLSLYNNIYNSVGTDSIEIGKLYKNRRLDAPIIVSVIFLSYVSSLRFSVKLVGADTRDEKLVGVVEAGEPLTLTRF